MNFRVLSGIHVVLARLLNGPPLVQKGRLVVSVKSVRNLRRFQWLRLERLARGPVSGSLVVASAVMLALVIELYYPAWFSLPTEAAEQLPEDKAIIHVIDGKSPTSAEVERDRALSSFLAKRYRVSHDVTLDLVRIAYSAGHRIGVDPLLVIAVMAVESRLNPIAESVAGAKGLMQIIPKFHPEKLEVFGGEQSIFEPQTNIMIGSQILREYIQRTGDVSDGLRIYGGGPLEGENSYPARVLDEKRRLQQVVSQHRQAARGDRSRSETAL